MSELNPNPKEPDKIQHGLMEPPLKRGGQEALNNLPLNELNGIIHKTIETIKETVKNQKEPDIGSKTLKLEKTLELEIER
jgi:hypothetical protein